MTTPDRCPECRSESPEYWHDAECRTCGYNRPCQNPWHKPEAPVVVEPVTEGLPSMDTGMHEALVAGAREMYSAELARLRSLLTQAEAALETAKAHLSGPDRVTGMAPHEQVDATLASIRAETGKGESDGQA